MNDDTPTYEAPTLEKVGTLRELTLGDGIAGDSDHGIFITHQGYEIDVLYGAS